MEKLPELIGSIWVRYSKYKTIEHNGEAYAMPADGAAQMRYDPTQRPESPVILALSMSTAENIDSDAACLLTMFAEKYGLLGYGVEDPKCAAFPLGEPQDVKSYAGRSDKYGRIFSPMYAERASGFASWIRRLGERFSGDAEKLPAPSHPDESLKGVVEYTLEYMMERGIIHRCGYCGKFYCDENPESRFCDDACSFQHGLNGTIANTMKHFKGHLIGGG